MLMARIKLRISNGTLGLPPRRRDFRRRTDRKSSTVPTNSPTNTNRSRVLKANLRGGAPQHVDLLPQNQISASSRTLEQNKLVGADRSNVKTSTIEPEHDPIRPKQPTGRSFRQGQDVTAWGGGAFRGRDQDGD
jgi:hypothetical protein